MLFVHAHPDDETIATGGLIALLRDRRQPVCVLTLTRGELGEVIPVELRHLEGSPALAAQRETELAAAMHALGVDDQRYLGSRGARWPGLPPRRYSDSGMRWGDDGRAVPVEHPPADALTSAPLSEVASDIAAVIAELRPTVVVSYDEQGGYGHPDHVRAHQAARLAADVAGVPFLAVDPHPVAGSFAIDVSSMRGRVRAAMAAHRTQLRPVGDGFELSNGAAVSVEPVEHYRLIAGDGRADVAAAPKRRPLDVAVSAVAALIAGAAVGAIGTAVHQASLFALVLSLVVVTALLAGMRIVTESRLPAAFASAGLIGIIALFATPGAGGAVLIPATAAGYWWSFAPAAIAFIVLAWPRLRRTGGDRMAVARAKESAAP